MPSAEEAESLEMKLMRKIQLPGRLAGAWRGTFGWTEAGHEDSIRDTALSTAPRRGSAAPSWRSAKEWATRGHKQFPNSAVAPKLLKGHLLLPSAFLEATKCMCSLLASMHRLICFSFCSSTISIIINFQCLFFQLHSFYPWPENSLKIISAWEQCFHS